MILPTTFDAAVAMLRELIADPNLVLGIQTVAVVLLVSGGLAWLLVSRYRTNR